MSAESTIIHLGGLGLAGYLAYEAWHAYQGSHQAASMKTAVVAQTPVAAAAPPGTGLVHTALADVENALTRNAIITGGLAVGVLWLTLHTWKKV